MRSTEGYYFDGNNNGMPEGSPIDDGNITYYIQTAGDYNFDYQINEIDLDTLLYKWKSNNYEYELGPFIGDIPYIIPNPDYTYNLEDLMAFVLMWDWWHSENELVWDDNYSTNQGSNVYIDHNELIINLPAVFPASLKSPCKILFERVNRERKLLTTLLVPFLIGTGSVL